ncbi:orotidine 5'-phosphate decarboxylase [Ligilactobacillus salitolerans]|uniref:Orotidine 5'-phosphate decarboxylase n=1 Tax=Ligilactobacillus salitolerans TaxID=1808352 RepID=A0A401IWE0_9LACO|nr:orotidine-5'-phosphate decarboxylase [Ligilactobacillus salitolerans]GBG95817.1 orotidine 5'-phosphate decarboxylase [Ligilactobacillus salitolerans]
MEDKRPIVALDFADRDQMTGFLNLFPRDEKLFVKVGMELFYSCGPDLIKELTAQGHDVFLDLKCHDIPHTVEAAMRSISKLNVTLTTVHAAGGKQMLEAAKSGLATGTGNTKLVAITQLTSTSQEMLRNEQLSSVSMAESVVNYAQLANSAGLDGVVCSALEAASINQAVKDEFLTVVPGIRLTADSHNDQQRVVAPDQAAQQGAGMIVVGRSITQAPDPFRAYQEVQKLWLKGRE